MQSKKNETCLKMAENGGWSFETCKKLASGVILVFSLFFTSLIGFISLGVVYLPGFLLKLDCAQWIFDTLMSTWFIFVVAMYELIYGVKIVVNGDVKSLNKNRCTLIIMNHRTRLDWLFFFAVQLRYGSLRRFKIALKDEIRHVPGAGWAMQAGQFLFLKRRWEIDRDRITNSLKSFQRNGLMPQLLFFPEGTDYQQISREKSRRYATKNELDDYDYVLHPRTLGFTSLVNYMRTHNNLEQIVDATVSYPQNMLQRETDLLYGNIPREIIFTLKTYEIDEIPSDSEHRLTAWLEDRWKEKEEFLRNCYNNRQFEGSNNYTRDQHVEIERDSKVYMIGAILFWSFLTIMVVYFCMTSYNVRLLLYVLCGLYFAISCVIGIDVLFSKISNRG